MSETFKKNKKNKVVRGANRGVYDKMQVFEILDGAFLCHISFVIDQKPFIIPTAYARLGEQILIHGSKKSRMLLELPKQEQVCVAVTHLDGLVLARSAFHHSVNYRSVIIYGKAQLVEDTEEKMNALKLITNNILENRWDEVRLPNQKEMDVTSVISITMDSVSAKVRTGDPVDDKEDYELPIWAGVVPIRSVYENAKPDEKLNSGIEIPQSVQNISIH